jgi:hypothetical protein
MPQDSHRPPEGKYAAPLLLTCILTGPDAYYVAGALNERGVSAEEFTREAILEYAAR